MTASIRFTKAQRTVMWMAGSGGCFVHRHEVRTARVLERFGLAGLDDNGELRPGKRSDGERWYCMLTEAGVAELVHKRRVRVRKGDRDGEK